MTIKIIAAMGAFIALASAVLGYGHYQYAQGVRHTADHYEAAIKGLKAEAATRLADETEKTRLQERALWAAKDNQETQDAKNAKTVADLSDRLRRAAGPALRLRDPNATAAGCWPGGGGAQGAAATATADRPADAAEAPGLLSVPLTDLLQRALRESDQISNAYTSCRADSYSVRGEQPTDP